VFRQEELMRLCIVFRAISADTALRLGKYFKISPQFWLNLQAHYDLAVEEDRLGSKLDREVHALVRC
jgi:antitoxin HigA-1